MTPHLSQNRAHERLHSALSALEEVLLYLAPKYSLWALRDGHTAFLLHTELMPELFLLKCLISLFCWHSQAATEKALRKNFVVLLSGVEQGITYKLWLLRLSEKQQGGQVLSSQRNQFIQIYWHPIKFCLHG